MDRLIYLRVNHQPLQDSVTCCEMCLNIIIMSLWLILFISYHLEVRWVVLLFVIVICSLVRCVQFRHIIGWLYWITLFCNWLVGWQKVTSLIHHQLVAIWHLPQIRRGHKDDCICRSDARNVCKNKRYFLKSKVPQSLYWRLITHLLKNSFWNPSVAWKKLFGIFFRRHSIPAHCVIRWHLIVRRWLTPSHRRCRASAVHTVEGARR